MSFVEIYWVFHDIIKGIYYFITGKILIINTNPQITAIKQFRKVIEFFGESLPQLILQLYIWQSGSEYVDATSLTISIIMSLFSFLYNLSKLYSESRLHGMSIAEYALSLLQLSEIPIIKLVPRLPAIRHGFTEEGNFAYFNIDKQSLGPIIDALSDETCKLQQIKLSIDSIASLDEESLRMLSTFFLRKQIKIIMTRGANPNMILKLFQNLDKNKNGYLTFEQFKLLLQNTTYLVDEDIQKNLFKTLAIRRLKNNRRDRVYFYDFYESITGYKTNFGHHYDCTSIEYPIHFAIKYILSLFKRCVVEDATDEYLMVDFDIDSYSLSINNANNWYKILREFLNLVHFSIGMDLDLQLDNHNKSIFHTILNALNDINEHDNDINKLINAFIWKITILLFQRSKAIQLIDENYNENNDNNRDENKENIFVLCVRSKQFRLFSYLLHYKILNNDNDIMDINNIITEHIAPIIFTNATKCNLHKAVEFMLANFETNMLLHEDQKINGDIHFKLFMQLLTTPIPNSNVFKFILNSTTINKDNEGLYNDTQNLLSLAIIYREYAKTKHKDLSNTIAYIEQLSIMNQLDLNATYQKEIEQYRSHLLEIIKILTIYDNDLCIKENSNDQSALLIASNYSDVDAMEIILDNITVKTNLTKIFSHKYSSNSDMNLFAVCVNNQQYDVQRFLVENYCDEILMNCDEMNHPFVEILKDYKYYLTDDQGKNRSNWQEILQNLKIIIDTIMHNPNREQVLSAVTAYEKNWEIPSILDSLTVYFNKNPKNQYIISRMHFDSLKIKYPSLNAKTTDTSTTAFTALKMKFRNKNSTETTETNVEESLITNYKDNKVQKILLLGIASSGKSTIFRQLKCVYKSGFVESEINEFIPIMRRNCVSGMMTLLKKTQQLFEIDQKQNSDCYIDLDNISENVLTAIKTVVNFSKETFEDYEHLFLVKNDDVSIEEYTEHRMREKKNELLCLCQSISILWQLPEVQNTWKKRRDPLFAFSFPDNMEHFYNKIDGVFEWNFVPSTEDILKLRIRSTGLIHAYYEEKKIAFTITDVGGVRNERRKWVHGLEGAPCVIYVGALNDYSNVLFEDESKNAMIESIELFFEICKSKWFKRCEMILFLNKDDLFRKHIKTDKPLSACFNEDVCIYKKEYDDDNNYYPKTEKKADRLDEDDIDDVDGYIPEKIDIENNDFEYRARCGIYPKPDLTFSAKNTYDDGRWINESNEKWFEFIYDDYINFITEQYLSKNLHPDSKQISVHITTATDPANIKKVFQNVQNIVMRSNQRLYTFL